MTQKIVKATNEGKLVIGDEELAVAVLEDGERVITRSGMLEILGRPYKGEYKVEGLPAFIRASNLKPYISDHLKSLLAPVEYKNLSNNFTKGYQAEILVEVCAVYLDAQKGGDLIGAQNRVAAKCEVIIRALAKTGIVALIDEVTGYQEIRDKKALQALLDKYLRKELASWAKRFPDEFYRQIFRLRGWNWVGMNVKRTQYLGKLTKDIVYERLAPGILKELETKNPKDEKGRRKARHHQWLTEDIGHPALSQHLHALLAFMRISDDWASFYKKIQKAFPKRGDQLSMDFEQ